MTRPVTQARVILAGAGHAHAQVLRHWAANPCPGIDLIVVSPYALAPYSGMVPGWLAGTYAFADIVIDFPALCRRAGAVWIESEIDRLDPDRQCLQLTNGQTLSYDVLSLNIGATLTPPQALDADAHAPASTQHRLSLRPLAQLRTAYEALLQQGRHTPSTEPWHLNAVGGGPAGFEAVLAVLHRLRAEWPERPIEAQLLTRSTQILPDHPPSARRYALKALDAAGVEVRYQVTSDQALARINQPRTITLWATGAEAHAWQRDPARRGRLAVSTAGFIAIDANLRSLSHPNIFAVGDCAHWQDPLPKAGVYAVRMGPVLTHNLRAQLNPNAIKLIEYHPQHHFLTLLATSDGCAIAARGRLSLAGRWAWAWKDHIDRRFIQGFAAPSN